jgi:hypothetical protein
VNFANQIRPLKGVHMRDAGRNSKKERAVWKELMDQLRRILRKKEKPPEGDPYAYVGAPLRRGPKGRSGAAVAEIEDDSYRNHPPRS